MTQQQQTYYQQILQYLSQQNIPFPFCLDGQFYGAIFTGGNIPNGNDRKAIGREFSKQVRNNKTVSINNITVSVDFDCIYSTCKRCGYKDSANKIHYKII